MSDSGSDDSNSDRGHGDDDNNSDSESNNSEDYDSQYSCNNWGEPSSDREDEDADLYYEEYDDVDYYDKDIEDDAKANRWSDTNSDQYKLINVLEDVREEVEQPSDVDYNDYPYGRPSDWSCITDVSLRFGPRYDKHGREILELGSYYDSELGSLTPHTEEEDNIDARLATLNQKLMVHNLRILILENAKRNNEDGRRRVRESPSTHLLRQQREARFV